MTDNIWQQQTNQRAKWQREIDEIIGRSILPDHALRQPVPQDAERWDWGVTALSVAAIGICALWVTALVLVGRWAWEAAR